MNGQDENPHTITLYPEAKPAGGKEASVGSLVGGLSALFACKVFHVNLFPVVPLVMTAPQIDYFLKKLYHSQDEYQEIQITSEAVLGVIKNPFGSDEEMFNLKTQWVRVAVEESEKEAKLCIFSRQEKFEIGSFLSKQEKIKIASVIGEALKMARDARMPVLEP